MLLQTGDISAKLHTTMRRGWCSFFVGVLSACAGGQEVLLLLDKVLLPSSTYKIYTPTQWKCDFNSTVPQLESKADERFLNAADLTKKCSKISPLLSSLSTSSFLFFENIIVCSHPNHLARLFPGTSIFCGCCASSCASPVCRTPPNGT